jgi:hypothetical protein
MKYIFTFLIFIGLSSSAFGGIGDRYFCESHHIGFYKPEDKSVEVETSKGYAKFRIIWKKNDFPDTQGLSEINLAAYPHSYIDGKFVEGVEILGEHSFYASEFVSINNFARQALFSGGVLKYSSFSTFPPYDGTTVYATCLLQKDGEYHEIKD